MKPIEFEHWELDPKDPNTMRYVYQVTSSVVLQELKQRLDSIGMLPDEYFLMADEWENNREIPRGADINFTTDYGESEGVYVDLNLKWHEDGNPIIKSFGTGKTLGETGYDLDRMFLTASAITKAFHGEGWYNEEACGVILNLNAQEKKTLTEVLSQQEHTQIIQSLTAKLAGDVPHQEQSQTGPSMEMSS